MKRNAKPQPTIPPRDPLAVVTVNTGRSCFRQAGLPARIIAGDERTVFLGPTGKETEARIAEFTLEFPNGSRREFCQYGRDFVFPTT